MTEEKLDELLKNVPRDEQGRIIGTDMYDNGELAGPTGEDGMKVLREKGSGVPYEGRKCKDCRWYTRWCSESGKHITRYCLVENGFRTKSGLKKVKGNDDACRCFCEKSKYEFDY